MIRDILGLSWIHEILFSLNPLVRLSFASWNVAARASCPDVVCFQRPPVRTSIRTLSSLHRVMELRLVRGVVHGATNPLCRLDRCWCSRRCSRVGRAASWTLVVCCRSSCLWSTFAEDSWIRVRSPLARWSMFQVFNAIPRQAASPRAHAAAEVLESQLSTSPWCLSSS